MTWRLIGALAGLTLFSLACGAMRGAAATGSAAEEGHPLIGAPAPSFDLPSPNGERTISLVRFAGKPVVIDFWATWCTPCRSSFPAYQRIADRYGSKVTVIGISVDEGTGSIPKFARETGARFPLAWDEGQIVAKSYQPPTMPTSYVVDASGIVRFVHSGFYAGEEPQLESELDGLLK